jgi:hypothetical protein
MDFLFLAAKDGTFFQTRDPILEVGNVCLNIKYLG